MKYKSRKTNERIEIMNRIKFSSTCLVQRYHFALLLLLLTLIYASTFFFFLLYTPIHSTPLHFCCCFFSSVKLLCSLLSVFLLLLLFMFFFFLQYFLQRKYVNARKKEYKNMRLCMYTIHASCKIDQNDEYMI